MITVKRRPNESFDSLLRRLRKKVTRARVLSEVRKRRFLMSSSEKRRPAQRKAVRRERRRGWREKSLRGQIGSRNPECRTKSLASH